ncbi:MAG: DUF1772 domain-containing protein [Planctomycetota bacterium]|nr:DUF1772 domain-containing protein [Planctomycetota bacterium]
MTALVIATAVGAALVAGIFYAFSTFIMGALGRLAPPEGIRAMQSINIVVINPLFFAAFFGTALLTIALLIVEGMQPTGITLRSGLAAALYLVGCIGVTIAGNVPLNNRLAAADADDSGTHTLWQHYLKRWTFWNHVRTVAPTAAAVLLLLP